ncbi:MAG: hypothetical protein JO171_10545 [Paludibacterium sp.]|uniref:hypothetical protein n=1 Tax=Paludibacterium sp. TaxID=1917523 RepID=UPI0025E31D21|nr:hypothetical protein [Paludibacterium sp.]MBV8047584.1 hypothetical protein [Paludibacterium sp.]MBV8647574.1 hypothetical protein [Paludibacterium sp.]
MLATIGAEDFIGLIGRTCDFDRLGLPAIHLRILDVKPRQQAQPSRNRTGPAPFIVELACEPTPGLTDSLGDLALPAAADNPARRLEHVWIGRVIPAGRDPHFAYFQLPLN